MASSMTRVSIGTGVQTDLGFVIKAGTWSYSDLADVHVVGPLRGDEADVPLPGRGRVLERPRADLRPVARGDGEPARAQVLLVHVEQLLLGPVLRVLQLIGAVDRVVLLAEQQVDAAPRAGSVKTVRRSKDFGRSKGATHCAAFGQHV